MEGNNHIYRESAQQQAAGSGVRIPMQRYGGSPAYQGRGGPHGGVVGHQGFSVHQQGVDWSRHGDGMFGYQHYYPFPQGYQQQIGSQYGVGGRPCVLPLQYEQWGGGMMGQPQQVQLMGELYQHQGLGGMMGQPQQFQMMGQPQQFQMMGQQRGFGRPVYQHQQFVGGMMGQPQQVVDPPGNQGQGVPNQEVQPQRNWVIPTLPDVNSAGLIAKKKTRIMGLDKYLQETTLETRIINESLNGAAFLEDCNLSGVIDFDGRRPSDRTLSVVGGIAKCYTEFWSSNPQGHGGLAEPANYRLTFSYGRRAGREDEEVTVEFINGGDNGNRVHDAQDVKRMIIEKILGYDPNNLSVRWEDFCYHFDNLEYDHSQYLLKDHIVCWSAATLYEYYGRIRSVVKLDQKLSTNLSNCENVRKALNAADSNMGNMMSWRDKVPMDTPLYRFLVANQNGRDPFYDKGVVGLLRYLRNLIEHIFDGGTFNSDLSPYNPAYANWRFLEIVIFEVFKTEIFEIWYQISKVAGVV